MTVTLIFPIAITLISLASPLKAKIALLVINFIVPDSIPYVDEIIQVLGIAAAIKKLNE